MSEPFDLIIGLGKTGQSCLRYLVSQGESPRALDTRAQPPGLAEVRKTFPDTEIHVGGLRSDWLAQARRLIVSPGVSVSNPEINQQAADGKEVIGDIELFARAAAAPVAAITGSNAKSTVTALLAEVVKACGKRALAGGNLGTPALDLLGQDAELYVLELSSFQLETTYSLDAQVATILNISEDHLDRYSSLGDYIAAKQRIYDGCQVAVWNRDDDATRPQRPVAAQITFGAHAEADYHLDAARGMLLRRGEDLMPVADLQIKGNHNALNVLAVLAMVEALGLDVAHAVDTIRAFPGLPHRCQLVACARGVQWFDDSKGTNVGATLAALNGIGPAIAGKVILIAGGQGKGQDFSPLAAALASFVRHTVLIGEDAALIAAALDGQSVEIAADMEDAVRKAALSAEQGDAVLLSPACASFDMFSGYEERGQVFARHVGEVVHGA
ncbi:MAG: UDP-N-acetylmuramoyl-L-alanine--D-glutamate ligase [Alcanivoracaceae bacterium]|nr:UDP-N-acetylmuramoyl-L-alanine--D-glutamate ligase [Alcanivoracaceae bacterium]